MFTHVMFSLKLLCILIFIHIRLLYTDGNRLGSGSSTVLKSAKVSQFDLNCICIAVSAE